MGAASKKTQKVGKGVSKKKSSKPAPAAKPTRAVSGKDAGKAVDAYVERRNPRLKEVAAAVRRLVKKAVPASTEAINPWGVPTFELRGAFGILMVGKYHVTLGFTQGTSLLDPARLLEGTGKNFRHVKLATLEDTNDPNLRSLLKEAAVLNAKSPAGGSMRAKKMQ